MRVRLATMVTAGLLSTLAACSSSSSLTAPKALHDGTTIAPTAVILSTIFSGFQAPEQLVVRDSSQWAHAWTTAFALSSDTPPLPAVDFSREMIVGVALGNGSPRNVSVDGMRVEGDTATVLATVTVPGDRCVVLAVIAAPVVLAKLPRVDGPVRFEQQTQTHDCE